MLALAIVRIIVVANDGQKSAVIDLLQNTVTGGMTPEEARDAVTAPLEKFLEDGCGPLRVANA
jgi:hypothetical protein